MQRENAIHRKREREKKREREREREREVHVVNCITPTFTTTVINNLKNSEALDI